MKHGDTKQFTLPGFLSESIIFPTHTPAQRMADYKLWGQPQIPNPSLSVFRVAMNHTSPEASWASTSPQTVLAMPQPSSQHKIKEVIKSIDKIIVRKIFMWPRLQLDSSNLCSRPQLAKGPKLVILCIVVIKYIRILSKGDQMFQKSFLSSIEVD
jgi:hypothetical protein